MKNIITASISILLLCSGSGAYAQSAANTAQQPAVANSSPASADQPPLIDVSKLAPNQREYLVVAMLGQGGAIVPEQIAKMKDMYEKMPAAQQLQMVTQIASGIQTMPEATRDKIMKDMPPPRP